MEDLSARDQLALQQEREQRVKDTLLMRDMDKVLGVERHITKEPLIEMNIRLVQYVHQFQDLSLDSLQCQTIADFKQYVIAMQAKKIDPDKCICIIRDGNIKIFINKNVTRQSFKDGGAFYFIREELKGE